MFLKTAKLVLLSSLALKSAHSFQLQTPSSSRIGIIPNPSSPSCCIILWMGISHDYSRDTSSDTSYVDLDAVNDLLGRRLHARKTGDFDVADEIRDRLSSEHKVTVFDQDRVWVTGDGIRNRGGRGGAGREGRGGRGGRGAGRGGRGGGRGRRDFSSNFGPNGHDYDVCSQAGPTSSRMTEAAIHRMIAQRLMAKMNREFDVADKVQLEMAEEGIFVNDRTKEWRADGVRFIDPSEGRRAPSDRNRPYVQSRYSQPLPEDAKFSLDRIDELVAERSHNKKIKNFHKADSIRDALEQSCNVIIDDRVRQWSIGGSFGKDADMKRAHNEAVKSRSYAMSSVSLPLPAGVTQSDVQDRVDARMRARNNRQYKQSDALREEILEDFNVIIDDTIKMWSVGGDFGLDDPVNVRKQERGKYTRRGGGNLSDADELTIQDMLKERFEAKGERNFDLADSIRSHLYEQYNVNVDDKASEWRVLSDDYIQTKAERGARELDADEARLVDSQLARRIILKKNRQYGEADKIRDTLQDGYSILIDDKKKEWKVISSGRKRGMAHSYKKSPVGVNDQVVHDPWFDDDDDGDDTANTTVENVESKGETTSPPPPVISNDDLMSLTIPVLKEKLREAGKPVSGKKAELVDRLLA